MIHVAAWLILHWFVGLCLAWLALSGAFALGLVLAAANARQHVEDLRARAWWYQRRCQELEARAANRRGLGRWEYPGTPVLRAREIAGSEPLPEPVGELARPK